MPSASNRASAKPNGSSLTPPPRCKNWANRKPNAWTWSVPASWPIAWKRWKRSRMEGKEDFQHAGGGEYHYIPCLNDRNDWMHALTDLVHG